MSNNESTAPVMEVPIQGDANMKVTRQKGADMQRQALNSDPMTNMPVIQGDAAMLVTRQSGIVEGDPDQPGTLRADRPGDPHRIQATDMAIAPDKDAGFPGHPGVVPGNPNHPAMGGKPAGPVAGDGSKVVRIKLANGQEVEGLLVADKALPEDHKTGVVAGNPDAQVLTKEQMAAAQKPHMADRPALPDAALAVHDPGEYQRQMAEASTAAHPLNKRKAPKAAKKGKAAAKAGKAAKARGANKAAVALAEGDHRTATAPAPDPAVKAGSVEVDLDAEAKAMRDAEAAK